MRFSFLFFSLLFLSATDHLFAQNYYWVFFKDKTNDNFDPFEYFDAKAIERRIVNELPLFDNTDLPVNETYIQQISSHCSQVYYASRWLNAVAVASENIKEISAFSFVSGILQISSEFYTCSEKENLLQKLSPAELKILNNQTKRMGADAFKNAAITGKGVRIAIFDAGFPGVDKNSVFEHIRSRNGIIKTYDFVKNSDFVYDYSSHGTSVLSCIAGKINDTLNTGMATDAEFLLARTEHAQKEPFSEEVNWMQAMEWADKNGAQIINSSLGYTYHRYFTNQMDGRQSLVARAANMAAAKGILVVNAAGNDGDNNWKTLGTPADADSVLTVGGIDPETDYHTSFSSFGPNKRNIIKPNVSAFGHVIAANSKALSKTQGTSFSSPLVAGFAACALQSLGPIKCMDLFKEIEKSGHLYPYFDYAHGYGVPQAEKILNKNIQPPAPTFTFSEENEALNILVFDEYWSSPGYNLLYYCIKNEKGTLNSYYVINVKKQKAKEIKLAEIPSGCTVSVCFRGYTEHYLKR